MTKRPTFEEIVGRPIPSLQAVPTPRGIEETIRESRPVIPSLPTASWSRSMDVRSDEASGEIVQPAVVLGPRGIAPEPPPVLPIATPAPHDLDQIQRALAVVSLDARASNSAIEVKLDTFLGGAQRRDEIRIVLAALTLIAVVLVVVLLAVRL